MDAPLALPSCPFLPVIDRAYTAEEIHALGRDRSAVFYHTCLCYAQSLWGAGFPAKALLLVNRALSCRLPEVTLRAEGARPYHAVAWMLRHRPEGLFIGNPRRHYQHLATRMVEPHKPLRTWRAWGCWYLACLLLPEGEHPGDEKQIREEGVVEPRRGEIAQHLAALSPADDLEAWEEAVAWAGAPPAAADGRVTFREAGPEELPVIQALAREIWPQVFAPLLSAEQIAYMLEMMYALPVLAREVAEQGVRYHLIEEEGTGPVGYYAWEPRAEEQGVKLHKLYVKPACHGRGIGAQALRAVAAAAAQAGARSVSLRVNRHNRAAIRAYLREGFVFAGDDCAEIGGGFVMDDHLMVRALGPG